MVAKRASKQALKAEEVELRDYELVVIISPEVMDEKLDAIVDNISTVSYTHLTLPTNREV